MTIERVEMVRNLAMILRFREGCGLLCYRADIFLWIISFFFKEERLWAIVEQIEVDAGYVLSDADVFLSFQNVAFGVVRK